ncbi:MAG: 3-phosphoshikimate 1-carboxyvinyltransferase [Chthonomonas sp.]|nr:3-phosphoshikimate 1-carboxyvinyltransferase [Chthonomonas sp.]
MRIRKAKRIAGEFRPPSDKSITHRALLLAALSERESYVGRPLMAEDCHAMMTCLRSLGARAIEDGPGFRIQPSPWASPELPLNCGNSGTAMRLLAGAIASFDGVAATLIGDESLSRRPMKRVSEPLRQMGAQVEGDRPPLTIHGRRLHGIQYRQEVASAQVKSAILFATLRATSESTVVEPSQSRDHTERMMKAVGIDLMTEGLSVTVDPSPVRGFETTVPSDFSSAAFWIIAASLLPGSELVLRDLGLNPTRTGLLELGNLLKVEGRRQVLGEPVGDAIVERTPLPEPFQIGGELVPRLIDEIPIMALLATQLRGRSVIQDASELRIKESDRVAKTAEFLNQMGAEVTPTDDGMIIEGPTPLKGTTIDPAGDHRIAMSAAIAGLIAEGTTEVKGTDCINTSYPEFVKHLEKLVEY